MVGHLKTSRILLFCTLKLKYAGSVACAFDCHPKVRGAHQFGVKRKAQRSAIRVRRLRQEDGLVLFRGIGNRALGVNRNGEREIRTAVAGSAVFFGDKSGLCTSGNPHRRVLIRMEQVIDFRCGGTTEGTMSKGSSVQD